MALAFKLSVLKKTRIWKPLNVFNLYMMLFYSQTKKIKYFLDPPKKGARIRTVAIWLQAHVFAYKQQAVTWNFTRLRLSDSAQSNPFIKNYHLIIVTFSRPHFSIYDIFYTIGSTLSFNARATHFKGQVS